MLNISSKTKSHILVLIFGPHVPLWLPSIVTLHKKKKNVPIDRPYLEGLTTRKTGFLFFMA